jgi:hypothetical protein
VRAGHLVRQRVVHDIAAEQQPGIMVSVPSRAEKL